MTSFFLAIAVFQGILCIIQSSIFMMVYWLWIDFPTNGLYFDNAFFEYFISLFFIMYVSDLTGMLIFSAVKNNEIANLIVPIFIIVQLVFSGVLFQLEGMANKIAIFTASKWGMEAFGSTAKLNDFSHGSKDAYKATSAYLFHVWSIQGIFILVLIVACILLLGRMEKDSR